jgi:HPt (histidine-containing phosphotransfer) domain-containing protein
MPEPTFAPANRPAAAPDPAEGFDAAALAHLATLDPDGSQGVVPRVLRVYERSLQRALGEGEAAATCGDAARLSALAHTMKSSSSSVGATRFAAACAALERHLNAGADAAAPAAAERERELLREWQAAGEQALRGVRAMLG